MPDDWDRPTSVRPSPQVAPARSALVGQRLGHYLVKALIGSGGMGEVYQGEHPEIGKKVAIKVLKASGTVEREQVERMLAEARVVNAIRHPNIVDVFDFGRLEDGRPYLVMDWLEGEPLDAVLNRAGALPPAEAVALLAELCAPLAAAHAKGIIHRDLKPANVFVSAPKPGLSRQVKLLDFGLARSLEPGRERLTRAGMVVGTPDYLSPEQAAGLDVGPAADLYALGVIAYELLSGQLPFIAPGAREVMVQKVQQEPPHVSSRVPSVPPELDQLVFELMAHRPEQRPASAEAVQQRLARLSSQLRPPGTRSVALPAVREVAPIAPAAPAAVASAPDPVTEAGLPPQPRGSRGLTVLLGVSAGVVVIGLVSVLLAGRGAPVVEPPPATPIAHPVDVLPPPEPLTPPAPAPAPAPVIKPASPRPPANGAKTPVVGSRPPPVKPNRAGEDETQTQGELYARLATFKMHATVKYPGQAASIVSQVSDLSSKVEGARTKQELHWLTLEVAELEARYPLGDE